MRGPSGLERLAWKYRTLAALRARREAVEAAGASCFEPAESRERRRTFRRIAREFPGALRELDSFSAARLRSKADRLEAQLAHPDRREPAPGEWAAVVLDFHRTLRQALTVKRWLARRLPRGGVVSDKVVADFIRRLDRMHRLRGQLAGVRGAAGGGEGDVATTRTGEGWSAAGRVKDDAVAARLAQGRSAACGDIGDAAGTRVGIDPSTSVGEGAADLLLRLHRPPGGRLVSLVWMTLEGRHGRPRDELERMIFGGA
ncbi:MAG TPA: hypothetical protein VGD74_08300 [Vulgatibacter sp.]